MTTLMTRDQFRNAVFKRDGSRCVICHDKAQDAHHIMERRLFNDCGYYLDNGASVCGTCHVKCEETTISVDDVRRAAGITNIILPDHLYHDQEYDKWGNPILASGQRLRGELFEDISVQKILTQGKVLDLFTHYVKYPRTYHLPWSLGMNDDDRMHPNMSHFDGKQIVVTIKMDGENTTMYQDYIHARSISSGGHPSRNWVKAFHAQRQGDIPWGWRLCGENLYAVHSIKYPDLKSYFYGFSLWNDTNQCLPWDETLEWFDLLEVIPVPVLYEGIYDYDAIRSIEKSLDFDKDEGYVVRRRDGFHYREFRSCVGKFVRKNHIKTINHHWRFGQITPNGLDPQAQVHSL